MGLRGPVPKPSSQRRRRPDPDALPVAKGLRGSWHVDEDGDLIYTSANVQPPRGIVVEVDPDEDAET